MSDAASDAAEEVAPDHRARDLLSDLVEIPSPSGEETDCARRLQSFLDTSGREAWIDDAGNVRAPADDAVLYTSHLDTVPGSIPVRTETREGKEVLYGRGSVDATGSLVAMAVAAVRTGVSFVGVTGEETDSRGARHLVEDRDPPTALVNGEPSGWDAYALGYRGFLRGTYRVETAATHSSRPEPNGIQTAVDWWQEAKAVAEGFGGDTTFESVTATPVAFEGRLDDDGTAVVAEVDAEFRIPPSLSVTTVRAAIDDTVDDGRIDWGAAIPPVTVSPRTPVARAFRTAIRSTGGDPTPLHKTGTCDLNLFAEAWDCPMAVYGPGDSALDHAPNEHLPLPELDRAAAVLETVADTLQQ